MCWAPYHFVLGAQLATGEKKLICIPEVLIISKCMHGLQACLFKYITVATFHIYAQRGEDGTKRGVEGHALNSHGNYIVDHEKIMELCF